MTSRAVCMERKKWEGASEAEPATMTSRAMELASREVRVWSGVISGIDGRWRGGGTFFFAFMFVSTFALFLFALISTFVRGLTLAFTFDNV